MSAIRSRLLIEVQKKDQVCRFFAGDGETTKNGSVVFFQPTHPGVKEQPSAQKILIAYTQHGNEFLHHLDCEGVVFLWLPAQQTYILASDSMGLTPVYFYEDHQRLIVSDHVSGILSRGIDTRLNPAALLDFFSFFWVMGEATFFKGISRLPVGHIHKNGRSTLYWSYKQTGIIKDADEAAGKIFETVDQAVKNHLESCPEDIAAHLSGGVDSSVINLLVKNHLKHSHPLYSYGMRIKHGRDESRWIDDVRQKIDSNHCWVEPGYPDILTALGDIIPILGEPMAYPSVISRFLLEQQIQQMDVFNGRGVDELFSGYTWHLPPYLDDHMERRRVMNKKDILEIIPGLNRTINEYDPDQAYMDIYNKNQTGHPLEQSMSFDIRVLLRYWLEIEYHVSARFNHRCHMPVLDKEVVSLAAEIHHSLKASNQENKLIFKQAFRDLLPDSILNRPKMGLNMPFSALLNSPEGDHVKHVIQTLERRDFPELDIDVILDKFKLHREYKINWGWQFWGILAYITWKSHYLLEPPAAKLTN
jgi:asparagine synthase (glutamine-hydrolysing)